MSQNKQSGFILPLLLAVIVFIILAGVATMQVSLNNLRVAKDEYYRTDVQFAADAGLDAAIRSLNDDQSYTGTGVETTLLNTSDLKTTYQTTITDDPSDSFKKYLDVTAKGYSPATSGTPKVQRKYRVELRGVGGSTYSLVTGVGGLYMSNNAKIVGGNVYVNGEIRLSNSSQIGLTTNAVNVKAAHQNCPVAGGATYPRVCAANENGEPITLSGSAKIYGEVQGANQTTGTNMFNPGLVAGTPAPADLPTYDRDAQKAAVATTITGASAGCNNGTKTWAANTKITGDVTVSGTCKVTVNGNIWITGTLTTRNSSEVIVGNGLASQPVIMIDGSSGLTMQNASIMKSSTDATPKGFRIITYWSAASCSPDCSDVTGTDLYNSRNTTTISLDQSASGPQTEFYAHWSRVNINNSGNIGALIGQTVQLSNSGAITFGTSVTGVSGVSAWVVNSYKRTY